ncbi:MAG TPA: hypothetical protein VJT75_03570 [Thermoleophilaceae bacterium]|nr:hypothetical protein [Thermoleophilaceae bacterium]
MRRTRRYPAAFVSRPLPLSIALALLIGLVCAGSAAAQSLTAASRTDDVRRQARQMARQIAEPWREGRQYGNGRFVDEVGGYSSYGEAVLGYALISTGLREDDSKMIGVGLKAMHYATNRYSSSGGAVSVFQNMAVGLTYRLAERKLRDDDRWQEIRPTVQSFMRRQPLVRLRPDNDHFANHLLVECLSVFNYVRTGMTSSTSGAILGPGREDRYRYAKRFIESGVPHVMARSVRPSGGDNTLLLSDPPDKPLAYQGLSIGLYARAMDTIGGGGTAAQFTLRRALEASWRLTAPDGDLSYIGRNHEEAFTLAATAYGARMAQRIAGTSSARGARYEALALRALQRLREVHMGGPAGIWPVPATAIDEEKSRSAIDHGGYAPYGGLALMFLTMLADTEAPDDSRASELFADRGGTAILGRGESLFATQRIGKLWFAVRAGASLDRPTDVRYDGGLVRAKRQNSDGKWFDLIPTRPRLPVDGNDSAGPLIKRDNAGTAVFDGSRIRAHGKDGIGMVGNYRTLRGSPGITRRSDERFRPIKCGVQVAFPADPGEVLEYSVYLRDTGHVERDGGKVSSDGTTVSADPKPRIVLKGEYRSATDPEVVRVRLRWSSQESQRIRVRICAS